MAITKHGDSARLVLRMEAGTKENGELIVKTRTFNGMRAEAADDAVMAVAQALAGLQTQKLLSVARQDLSTLAQE